MSAKYNVGRTARWVAQGDNRCRFTQHALERYDERAPPNAVSPETAFEKGVEVPDYFLGAFEDAERARVYAKAAQVVFVMKDGYVITTYQLGFFEPHERSYLSSLFEVKG